MQTTNELKTVKFVLRQAWGAAKNQLIHLKSCVKLMEEGENDKALSLLQSVKGSQEFHNDILSAQINELEQRIFDINSNVKKPKYNEQDWREWEQYQYGEIIPNEQPPMVAPPLDDEFYSEPNQQEETFIMGKNPFN